MGDFIGGLLGLGLVVGLFLLLRQVFCWYWKLNEITAHLRKDAERAEKDSAALQTIAVKVGKLLEEAELARKMRRDSFTPPPSA